MVRFILLTLAISATAWSQSMLESAGIAAGSAVGSVAGKQVSNGITTVLNKTAKQVEASAKDGKQAPAPLLQVGPATPKQTPYNVPPPPPLPRAKQQAPVTPEPEPVIEVLEVVPPPPPPPPPPVMTAATLTRVQQGMRRSEVLGMGRNAVRIMRTENGHVEESYHYHDGSIALGVVRFVDGKVSRIEIQP